MRALLRTHTIFHTIFSSIHIMHIFYASKRKCCRHWKTWWNMFTYFWCRWILRIIFTAINLSYYTLKICINNKWCFIRFLIMRLKFVFCCERIKVIQTKKSLRCLEVIPLNNAASFWLQNNDIVCLRVKSLRE